jgi:hypothetical protein
LASQLLCHPKQFSTPGGIELGEGLDEGKELGVLLGIQGQWAYWWAYGKALFAFDQ